MPTKTTNLEVPPIKIGRVQIKIIGTVCHRFDEKAIKQIQDKQEQKATKAREAKKPTDDFMRSLYPIAGIMPVLHDDDPENVYAEGRFGFPCIGFKAAAVRAATDAGAQMTLARRAFHIDGDLVEILGDHPKMRRDMVRVGMGTADVRFRAEFTNWNAEIVVKFNAGIIDKSQLVNLFRLAGFGVGVGEWRPEKDGQWGTFTVGAEIVDLGEEQV